MEYLFIVVPKNANKTKKKKNKKQKTGQLKQRKWKKNTFFYGIYILKSDAVFFLSKMLKYFNDSQNQNLPVL